jgi:hypothetical protein
MRTVYKRKQRYLFISTFSYTCVTVSQLWHVSWVQMRHSLSLTLSARGTRRRLRELNAVLLVLNARWRVLRRGGGGIRERRSISVWTLNGLNRSENISLRSEELGFDCFAWKRNS